MLKVKCFLSFMLAVSGLFVSCESRDEGNIIAYDDDVWDVVDEFPQLSTLKEAVSKSGMKVVLDNENTDLTFFAPINNAFAALSPAVRDSLMIQPEVRMRNVIEYHTVKGYYTPEKLSKNATITASNGSVLRISGEKDNLRVNGAMISEPIYVTNGVIYMVSEVLLPTAKAE